MLMAECEVLEGDGRRPKEPGAQEGPETLDDSVDFTSQPR
jgi:hypothetical protein